MTMLPIVIYEIFEANGGEGGIRTHETLSRLLVFKTSAFNRSATSPLQYWQILESH